MKEFTLILYSNEPIPFPVFKSFDTLLNTPAYECYKEAQLS